MTEEEVKPVVTAPVDVSAEPIVKQAWWWIKDSKGVSSVSTTFVTVAFLVTTVAYILSLAQKIGPVTFRPFDSIACGIYFVPLCGLYFGRKMTDTKYSSENK